MALRFGALALVSLTALSATVVASNDAHACGGCFHPEDQPETTVVTAHRMAFSISPTQTVLWDQVKYQGAPSEFAWVLPIKPGAFIELSSDAWFESLDAATSTRVVAPQVFCSGGGFSEGSDTSSGCGCGALGAKDFAGGSASGGSGEVEPPPTVTVVHEGSIGPYDTVTLHANVQGALTTWLTDHKFAIDATVQPIIDAYSKEGFDFIALRLQPGQGVQQMKPVRVVSPGATPTLPLRMVAAGTGANVDITLFVIGEGRWESKNFPNAEIDPTQLSWDFNVSASNYAALRQQAFAANEGRTWINAYARQGALLSQVINPVTQSPVQYGASGFGPTTIGGLFVAQALLNDETKTNACQGAFESYADSTELVVNPCPMGTGGAGSGVGGGGTGGAPGTGGGGTGGAGTGGAPGTGGAGMGGAPGTGGAGGGCGVVDAGQIDARELACGTLDDIAVALTGMHPHDVWVTRLESNLPHAALKDDFELQAASEQVGVENWFTATEIVNPPCATAIVVPPSKGGRRLDRNDKVGPSGKGAQNAALLLVALAAVGAAFTRRARRPRPLRVPARRTAT